MTTVKNAFETAIILVKDGIATDTGICTWADDDRVTISFEADPDEVQVFYRYANRESDLLPPIVATIGLRQFAQEVASIKVIINNEVMPWKRV